jgi:nucleoside phosphorylase
MGSTFYGDVDAPGSIFGDHGKIVNTWATKEGRAEKARSSQPKIGIVTALPEEHAAVMSILDDRSAPRGVDPTAYDGGTLPSRRVDAPHRVVLTALVEGGNDVAATAFTSLVSSFPSVTHVLMCGIAAGVPAPYNSQRHVRLGDIVVASWGIVEYDHVDQRADGVRLRPGSPKPSVDLLRADSRLASGELRGQRPWEETLREHGVGTFRRPDDDTDLLFNEFGNVVPHPKTDHPTGMPTVHRGLVGSADRSLRESRFRDQVAALHNLLAFEMEGKGIGNAGFLNNRQWFVVRGISDYGDSHTTATWRPYAAMAAAAYLRALLAECEPLP